MRYEAMGCNRTQRLNIPQLFGGLNTATDPTLIEDDELSAVCNLTFDHGALVTREAVRAVGDEVGDSVFVNKNGKRVHVNSILRQPTEINGVMSTVVVSSVVEDNSNGGENASAASVDVVSLDGNCARYIGGLETSKNLTYAAIAPCDFNQYKAAFLVYIRGYVYEPDGTTMKKVTDDQLYAPLVMINGRSTAFKDYDPAAYNAVGNGVMYEGYNALTQYCRASFTPTAGNDDPGGEIYQLPSRPRSSTTATMEIISSKGKVTVSLPVGNEVSFKFSEDDDGHTAKLYYSGILLIQPSLPVMDVANTVTITYQREDNTSNMLLKASMATWFGGTQNDRGGTRLFLADAESAKLMWSDVNNPFYFPENNYMIVGDASQKITALEKQGDMLVIFKEREMYYTTYVQGEVDAEAVAEGTNVDVTAVQAYFPLTQLSPQIGCRCPHSIALCCDRLVWMDSDARVYTLVITGAYSERNVREIGQKVRPFILENTTEAQRKAASAIDHKGKYRLMIGSRMVEFDYNDSGFVNVSGYSSGERAARNIAWMAHKYSFGDNAVQTLISDGADQAIVISTVSATSKIARFLYSFLAEGTDDRYVIMSEDSVFGFDEQPIPVSLTTKQYEFGDPAAFKRIGAFYPMMQAENAELFFIVDGAEPPYGKPYRSADTFAHLVLPCVHRCRTFGLRMDATGKVCIKGMQMQYTMFGNVK